MYIGDATLPARAAHRIVRIREGSGCAKGGAAEVEGRTPVWLTCLRTIFGRPRRLPAHLPVSRSFGPGRPVTARFGPRAPAVCTPFVRINLQPSRNPLSVLLSSTLFCCALFLPHGAPDLLYLVFQFPPDLGLLPAGHFSPRVEFLLLPGETPLLRATLLRLLLGMTPRLRFALLLFLRQLFLFLLPSFNFPPRPLHCLFLLLSHLLSVLLHVKRTLCERMRSKESTDHDQRFCMHGFPRRKNCRLGHPCASSIMWMRPARSLSYS